MPRITDEKKICQHCNRGVEEHMVAYGYDQMCIDCYTRKILNNSKTKIKKIFDRFECFLGKTYLSRADFEKIKKEFE